MSRIDELIAELCPGGVPFKALGEIAEVTAGATPSKAVEAYWSNGTIPWLNSGEVNKGTIYEADTLITQAAYDSCSTKMVRAGAVVIALAGQGKTRGMVARTRLNCCTNQSLAAIIAKPILDNDFLYFYLSTQYGRLRDISSGDGTRGGLNLVMIREYRVPVPPIEVQREIVRILDQFTALEAELEAELEARRAQASFYRRAILTPLNHWQTAALGDIAKVFDGPHATPKKTEDGPWYLSISSLRDGRFDFGASAHLSDDDLPRWTQRVAPRRGDTLFSYETRIGQVAFWDCDEPAALGRRMGLLRPEASAIHPRFLTFAYLGPQFQSVIRANTIVGSTVDRIPVADIAKWPLSFPPLDEQRRIVAILDQFDALVNDLSVGLPAELAARRKQYEYYRDRLLTFAEAS